MHSLEIALLVFTIYNNLGNPNLFAFSQCYFLSHILAYIVRNKFTIAKQINYCDFADKRCIHGIPNIGDVISNLAFILAGFYQYVYNDNINLGIICILIGIGSTYFHWTPSLITLYWDRLPMIIGMAYIMYQYTEIAFQELLLHGLLSLEYRERTNDLSLYVAYQLNMIIFLIWTNGFSLPVIFYIMAKEFEDYDKEVYTATKQIISGHTIKHILAGIAMLIA